MRRLRRIALAAGLLLIGGLAHAQVYSWKDSTIREKFNTYRFADYKVKVIELLARVTTVSIRTVELTSKMARAARDSAR